MAVDETAPRRIEPVLITEAAPSRAAEHAARKKRYALTMALRVVCLILAAIVAPASIWAAVVFMVLMTILPWIAVVMANDRPPKKKVTPNRYQAPPPDRILETGRGDGRVIDG